MNNFDLLIPQAAPSTDTWTWATVTAVKPVKIRIDGDAEPLPITPTLLVPNPAVGDRVWVQLTGRRAIIQGSPAPLRSDMEHPWIFPEPNGKGHMVYDTLEETMKIFNGVAWVPMWQDSGWRTPELLNAWEQYPGYEDIGYRRLGSQTHLRGMVRSGTRATPIFTLPLEFRPKKNLIVTGLGSITTARASGAASTGTAHTHTYTLNEAGVRINVNADGTVAASTLGEAAWISFAGVSFFTD